MNAHAGDLLWVGLGSAFDGMARFAVSGVVARTCINNTELLTILRRC